MPCRLPGCWELIEQAGGRGRPRHYCCDDHRRAADLMRTRTIARLMHMREMIRRDEHLLAVLGGADDSAAMQIDPEPPGVTFRKWTPEEIAALDGDAR
jgi:hypothetical protein